MHQIIFSCVRFLINIECTTNLHSKFWTMKFKLSIVFVVILLLNGVISRAQKNADSPEHLVTGLYKMLTISTTTLPDWDKVKDCFHPKAIIILRSTLTESKELDVDEFIADFQNFIDNSDVVKQGFSESVLNCEGEIFGNTAWYSVVYEAKIQGTNRKNTGVDHFSLADLNGEWKIVSIVNEVVTADRPLPDFLTH